MRRAPLGCSGSVRGRHKVHRRKVRMLTGETREVVVYEIHLRSLLRLPSTVTERHLRELRAAGYEVDRNVWGEPIARAPGGPWFTEAAYAVARLRFRRGR